MGQITRENGGWAVRGYSAAVAALRDPHLVVGRAGSPLSDRRVPSVEEFFGGWFTVTDAHAEIKGVLARAFSARRIAGFAAAVADLARVQVAGLPDDGDLVADCLTPFAVDCVSALAGIPAGAATRLVAVTRLLTAAIHGATREADEPLRKCVEYLRAVTVRVGATPLGDVLREVAGRFGTWTATAVLAQLLTAGVEPTTTGAALAYREIVRDPDLLVARPRGLAGSRPAHDVPGRVAETTKYVQYEAVAAPCQERRGQADT
ncbi:hypothetical protein, partial [Actinokineospora inagensis]|uniref:hypothetical protein n=1 Tax=Actinokineospora inagensis TaxID=103730 RepID=UPI00047D0507